MVTKTSLTMPIWNSSIPTPGVPRIRTEHIAGRLVLNISLPHTSGVRDMHPPRGRSSTVSAKHSVNGSMP